MKTLDPDKDSALKLRITLRHVKPLVWRRLLVPVETTLAELHFVVNETMGWSCSHLHAFSIDQSTYSDPELDPAHELQHEDERPVQIGTAVGVGQNFEYRYDFGDDWYHDILVEERIPVDARLSYPLCIGGERACPPEDCGGPVGYEHLLEALGDGGNPRHDEMTAWVGGHFDPAGFDANRVNAVLRAMYEQDGCSCEDCECEHGEHGNGQDGCCGGHC